MCHLGDFSKLKPQEGYSFTLKVYSQNRRLKVAHNGQCEAVSLAGATHKALPW